NPAGRNAACRAVAGPVPVPMPPSASLWRLRRRLRSRRRAVRSVLVSSTWFSSPLHAVLALARVPVQGRLKQVFQVCHGLFVADALVHSLLQEGFELRV